MDLIHFLMQWVFQWSSMESKGSASGYQVFHLTGQLKFLIASEIP